MTAFVAVLACIILALALNAVLHQVETTKQADQIEDLTTAVCRLEALIDVLHGKCLFNGMSEDNKMSFTRLDLKPDDEITIGRFSAN